MRNVTSHYTTLGNSCPIQAVYIQQITDYTTSHFRSCSAACIINCRIKIRCPQPVAVISIHRLMCAICRQNYLHRK